MLDVQAGFQLRWYTLKAGFSNLVPELGVVQPFNICVNSES